MTLKAKITRISVRTGAWCRIQRRPSRMSRPTCCGSWSSGAHHGGQRDLRERARPRAARRSPARRRAGRAPRRRGTPRPPARPSGWRRGTPTSGARSRCPGRRGPRSRAGRPPPGVGEDLGRPDGEQRRAAAGRSRWCPVTIVPTSSSRTTTRSRLAVRTSRLRSTRSAIAPANSPRTRVGTSWTHRRGRDEPAGRRSARRRAADRPPGRCRRRAAPPTTTRGSTGTPCPSGAVRRRRGSGPRGREPTPWMPCGRPASRPATCRA